ncbi:MAG: hypothetical protein JKX91_12620, partial [Rhizobiaceae bacterium]|nr:hypothetical protein [Rhizobiaceae bacterium]
ADKFNDQRCTSHERWRPLKSERHAASELGKTVVIVLHDINFASCYSDKIIIMNEGKLAYQGAPANVITPKIMKEIYDINITVHIISGHLMSDYYQ